jgi:hypothetical protein
MTTTTLPQLPSAAPSRKALHLALWAAVALYIFVGAFPSWSVPGSTILDAAWVLEVNRLALGAFGRDVAFTYGPFGFLLYPAASTTHVVLALLLRCSALAGLAAWVLVRGSTTDRIVFALIQVVAVRLGLTFEYQLLVPVLLLAARSLETPARGDVAWAALAAATLFVKFSLGISLAAIVGTAWLLRLLRDRTRGIRGLAVEAGVWFSALLLAAAVGLERVADLVPWIRRSLEMAGGYSEVMSLESGVPARDFTALVAAALVAALVGLGAWGVRRGAAPGRVFLLSAGPAFLAFKHAFVRQDAWHTTLFFPLMLSIAAAAGLVANTRTERIVCRGMVIVTAALSFWVANSYEYLSTEPAAALTRSLAGLDGTDALRGWLDVDKRRTESAAKLAPYDPPTLPAVLGGRAVGVVPYRIGFCAAPGVMCTPNPTLQTFAAYTAGLDTWSGDHYLDQRAPPFVLLHLDDIDGRSPALDHPFLWRALLAAYRVARQQPGGALLLERRSTFVKPALAEIGRSPLPVGRWVHVPFVPGALYAAITLDPTWLGRAQRLAFRVGPVFLSLEYPGGLTATFRLVPGTARNGLPLDQIPLAPQDLPAFFDGRKLRRPSRIALFGDGLDAYRQPILVSWQMATVAPEPHGP